MKAEQLHDFWETALAIMPGYQSLQLVPDMELPPVVAFQMAETFPFASVAPFHRSLFYRVAFCELRQEVNIVVNQFELANTGPQLGFLGPGQTCSWDYRQDAGAAWTGIMIWFRPEVLGWTLGNEVVERRFAFFSKAHSGEFRLQWHQAEFLRPLFNRGYELIHQQPPEVARDLEIAAILQLILVYSARVNLEQAAPSSVHPADPFTNQFFRVLDELYPQQRLRMMDISRQLSVSVDYLYERVKDVTGHSPKALLNLRRLEEAKRLLEVTHLPIKAVSALCGFEDHSYFIRFFKQQTGHTPAAWRNMSA